MRNTQTVRLSCLKVLTATALSLVSTVALAATPEQVIRKADDVQRYVSKNAYRMSPSELRSIDQALSSIRIGSNGPGPGGPGPGHGPGPSYPPNPRSTCELLGRGDYANWTYSYRLALNGQVMEGSDQLDTILARIAQYRRDGACGAVVQGSLTLGARGDYANWTYSYLVKLNGIAISGSDNLETALATIAKIDQADAGVVSAPRSACQLLPRGNYANWTYAYRVGVGSEVMSGSDSYSTAQNMIQRLRSANVCY